MLSIAVDTRQENSIALFTVVFDISPEITGKVRGEYFKNWTELLPSVQAAAFF